MATRLALAKQTAQDLQRIQDTMAQMAQEVGIDPPSGFGTRKKDALIEKRDTMRILANWLEAYHAAVSLPGTGADNIAEVKADTPRMAKGKK